jgi:hypothetical protein
VTPPSFPCAHVPVVGQVTCFVHGVGEPFLAVGDAAREAAAAGNTAFTAGAYFIGKAVWGKVRGLTLRPRRVVTDDTVLYSFGLVLVWVHRWCEARTPPHTTREHGESS